MSRSSPHFLVSNSYQSAVTRPVAVLGFAFVLDRTHSGPSVRLLDSQRGKEFL
jgi:hypothetical protein